MSAQQLLADGKVTEALAEVQQTLRAKPADGAARAFYAQLLMVQGEWEMAAKQVDSLAQIDPKLAVEAQIARQCLICETQRTRVFEKGVDPTIMGEPSDWLGSLVAANKAFIAGRHEKAAELRDAAFSAAPATSGRAGGQAFEWMADADERLGPVLEAFLQGSYYWIPMHRVSRIEVTKPKYLQDVVWASVQITTTAGGTVAGLMPVRYPGTPGPDDLHRLARATSFETVGGVGDEGGVRIGHGQRAWITDSADMPMLEAGVIEFDHAETEA
jgi:type VI secretion system protein ImpE